MSLSPIDWQLLREELRPDGSLRDIYVHNTDAEVWHRFLVALPRSSYRRRIKHGDTPVPGLFSHFNEAAKLAEIDPVLMEVELSPTLVLACHFFTVDEIELDVVPNDLQDAAALDMLIAFMRWLSHTVDRPVVLTHENSPENVILRVT